MGNDNNDNIEFFTENHEFKIVLTKRQKVYSSAISVVNACYNETNLILSSFIYNARLACNAKAIDKKEDE